jgi:hypothetical protein
MKKNNVYHFLFAWLCIAATSCSKDKVDASKENGQVLTSQIEKIETVLAKGATKQNVIMDDVPKIETRASDETMRKIHAQMRQEVDQSYQKTRVMGVMGPATHPRAFAVFKEGSCFGYPRVFIKMDCEDRRPATSSKGWTGDSHVDHGDMYLDFCIINDNYANYMGVDDFGPTNSRVVNAAYGFLYLGQTNYLRTDPGANSGFPAGWRNYWYPWPVAVRVFDNEDNGANNQVWENDQEKGLTYWLSPGTGNDDSYVAAGNTRLHWIIVPGGESTGGASRTIPGMLQYGLLGKFGPTATRGELHTDDEDTNNQNVFEVGGYYNRTNSGTGAPFTNTFPWSYTIEGVDNTWLHLSRVF